jgi:hypothetical protein
MIARARATVEGFMLGMACLIVGTLIGMAL